ncbi:ABC transporter permease, partial [Vibrio sp.]|nr:ABC transporter permease [Vibrio sp.]
MMNNRSPLKFYYQWSLRELRSSQLWPIAIAIVLIVASIFSMSAISERMSQAIDKQGKDALLGDIVFESANPPPSLLLDAQVDGVDAKSLMTRFSTMMFSGTSMKLVMVKAVEENYPLRGNLKLERDGKIQDHVEPGTVWLDKSLMTELGLKVGDDVAIGDLESTITGVIAEEPGISFNPFRQLSTVYISQKDLSQTGAIQVGSRVEYNVFINASSSAIDNVKKLVELQPGDEWEDTDKESRASQIFDKTRQYVSMIVVVIVLMATATLVVTSQSYVKSRSGIIRALRSMGANKGWIKRWLVVQLGMMLGASIVIGLLLGIAFERLLRIPLASLLPDPLPVLTFQPYLIAIVMCISVLIPAMGLPISRLWKTGIQSDRGQKPILSVLGRALIILLPLVVMLVLFNGNIIVWLMLAGVVVLFVVLGGVSLGIISFANKLVVHPVLKLALTRMNHTKFLTGLQLGALSLSLMLISVVWMVKTDLFSDWQSVLPDNSPNVFAFNISTAQKDSYHDQISEFATEISPMFPIVRGRITEINGENAAQHAGGEDKSNALRRDLNFTWANSIPDYNKVLSGVWTNSNGVSVESGVAEELNIKVGDKLSFVANSITFSAVVNSIREVEWRSMKPNFFFIFTPDVMKEINSSWLVSYRLDDTFENQFSDLSRHFPTVSVIDLRVLTEKIQGLLGQVVWAISLLSLLAVMAGLLLIVTVLALSISTRRDEVKVYRTLGSSQKRIQWTLFAEFGFMGVLGSIVACAGAELIVTLVNQHVFGIESSLHWGLYMT